MGSMLFWKIFCLSFLELRFAFFSVVAADVVCSFFAPERLGYLNASNHHIRISITPIPPTHPPLYSSIALSFLIALPSFGVLSLVAFNPSISFPLFTTC